MTLSTGVGRGFRNPANAGAATRGGINGIHTRVVGPLRSWEGLRREVPRERATELLEGELDVLCVPESFEAIELRALLHIREHATRGNHVPLPGSRRDMKRRYAELNG